jgi:hypothetical protein
MILGISGRIGSGKDTVGLIIQYLTDELNKDNPKEFTEWVDGGFHASDWEIKKYAGKLKEIACMLTGCTLEQLENQEFKKLQIGPDWGMTYRELLQKLGTEAMRNGLHENVWVNALFADYSKYINQATGEQVLIDDYLYYKNGLDSKAEIVTKQEPNWCITDMRFPNEFDAVKSRDGITIRVNRTNRWNKPQDIEHASETALDNHEFDYVIDNDSSISDLIEKVRTILIKEKVI